VLDNFRLQPGVPRVGGVGELMLVQRAEQQRLVHRNQALLGLRRVVHLNHDSHGAFSRDDRPQGIRPAVGFDLILFGAAFGLSGAEDAVEQPHTSSALRQHFAKRLSEELFRGLVE
jgi:hypothetical protein